MNPMDMSAKDICERIDAEISVAIETLRQGYAKAPLTMVPAMQGLEQGFHGARQVVFAILGEIEAAMSGEDMPDA